MANGSPTASWDMTARIWDAATGRERARLEHQRAVNEVAISPVANGWPPRTMDEQ